MSNDILTDDGLVRQRKVTLENYEMLTAAWVGVRRQIGSIHNNRQDQHGCPKDGLAWYKHILGAMGEMAAAKGLNMHWSGSVDTFSHPDVGPIQVRTRSEEDYGLLVRPKDSDDAPFLLVTGEPPDFILRGWMWGRQAKQNNDWLKPFGGRKPAYFVPQKELNPIEHLISKLDLDALRQVFAAGCEIY